MIIQIDTESKTVKLTNRVNLGKFIDKFSTMFEDWRDYKIIPHTAIQIKEFEKNSPFNPYKSFEPMYNDLFKVTSKIKIEDTPKKGYVEYDHKLNEIEI